MLSIIIPHWPIDGPASDDLLRQTCEAIPPGFEKIIVVNDGTGYCKALNRGVELATQSYVALINNDIILRKGNLIALCQPGRVRSPMVTNRGSGIQNWRNGFHGSFFVIQKRLYQELGGLDEEYGYGYFSDNDFVMKLRAKGIPCGIEPAVVVDHLTGMTNDRSSVRDTEFERNKVLFESRWSHDWEPGDV